VDYSWWNVNQETLLLTALDAMQFGHAFDCILTLMKLDISDGFYLIALNVNGITFPDIPLSGGHRPAAQLGIQNQLLPPMHLGRMKNPQPYTPQSQTHPNLGHLADRGHVSFRHWQ
jgi:hypothetical protein